MKTRITILFALLLLVVSGAFAQVPVGREFIVVLPPVLGSAERLQDIAGFFIEVNCPRRTEVTARFGNGNFISTQSIEAGGRAIFTKPYIALWQIMLEPNDWLSERVSKMSVVITTDETVTVQAVIDSNYRTETYAIWPTSSYDTLYHVVTTTADNLPPAFNSKNRNGFVIMAGEDGTDVYITPSQYTAGLHPPGQEYKITLNRYEVYEVRSTERNGTIIDDPTDTLDPLDTMLRQLDISDMSGSKVRSNKPIGIASFCYSKPVVEYISPASMAGREFFVAPITGSTGLPDTVYAQFAVHDFNTTFTRNGVPLTGTYEPGDVVGIPVNTGTHITTTGPVTAMLVSTSGAPMMIWLPPVDLYRSSLQFGTPILNNQPPLTGRPAWEHLVMIIAPDSTASTVTLDGNPVNFSLTFPGGYVGAIKRVHPGRHTVLADAPVCALAYGFTSGDAYGTASAVFPRAVAQVTPDTLRVLSCEHQKDSSVTISNVGAAPMRIDSLLAIGVTASLYYPPTLPITVAPGNSVSLIMRFSLPSVGVYNGALRIYVDADNVKQLDVPLVVTRDSSVLGLPSAFDIGALVGGETTRDTFIVVPNNGTTPVRIDTIYVLGSGFTLTTTSYPRTIAPGYSDTIRIRFTSAGDGLQEATFRVIGGPCLEPTDVKLRGFRGRGPAIGAVSGIDYGRWLCERPLHVDTVLIVRSVGGEPLLIDSVRLVGAQSADFTLNDILDGRSVVPGDSAVLRIRYVPTGSGNRSAKVEIYSNASNAPTLVTELRSRIDTSALRVDRDTLDFGVIANCGSGGSVERRVLVHNDGTQADTIRTVDLSGVDEYVLGQTLPIIIAAGNSQEVIVKFVPDSDGVYATTLLLGGGSCGGSVAVNLKGKRQTPSLVSSIAELKFDTLYSCVSEVEGVVVLTNNGSVSDTLQEAQVVGSSAFAVVGGGLPRAIAPGASDSIRVRFATTSPSVHSGVLELVWSPCSAEVLSVKLEGVMLEASLALSSDTVDFGIVEVGTSGEGRVILKNVGTVVRRIEGLDRLLPSDVSLVSPQLPIELAAGDSVELVLAYSPISGGILDASTGLVVMSPCAATYSVVLKGRAEGEDIREVRLALSAGSLSGTIDSEVLLPIDIISSEGLGGLPQATMDIVVSWRYTVLAPLGVSTPIAGVSATIVGDTIEGDLRHVHVRLIGGVFPSTGRLVDIRSLVLLGDTDRTALGVDVLSLNVIDTSISGEFVSVGICVTGGDRLVELGSRVLLRSIRPNPVRDVAGVRIGIERGGDVDVLVMDMLGNVVVVASAAYMEGGEYDLAVDMSDVASGLYVCEVRKGRGRVSGLMIVVR